MKSQFSTCPILFPFTLLNLSASVDLRRSWICALEVVSQLLLESVQADIRECLTHMLLVMGCCVTYTWTVLPLSTSYVFTSSSLPVLRSFETSAHLLSQTVADKTGVREGMGEVREVRLSPVNQTANSINNISNCIQFLME